MYVMNSVDNTKLPSQIVGKVWAIKCKRKHLLFIR